MKKLLSIIVITIAILSSISTQAEETKQAEQKTTTEKSESTADVWIYHLIDILREGPIAYV